jgi:hypothetical protein
MDSSQPIKFSENKFSGSKTGKSLENTCTMRKEVATGHFTLRSKMLITKISTFEPESGSILKTASNTPQKRHVSFGSALD